MKGYDEFGDQSHRMTTETKQQTRKYVQAAAAVCEDKKGLDTRILELDPIDSGLSDFFLVTSASNDRQAIAIADEIEDRLKKEFGVFPNSVEGRRQGQWILLDYVDFVVHVFLADRRAFYDIERLRKSARPLTPAEFDAELKAELAAKTLAARGKAAAKPAGRQAQAQAKQAGKESSRQAKSRFQVEEGGKEVRRQTQANQARKESHARPKEGGEKSRKEAHRQIQNRKVRREKARKQEDCRRQEGKEGRAQ
jgi:ribosome-associated protein